MTKEPTMSGNLKGAGDIWENADIQGNHQITKQNEMDATKSKGEIDIDGSFEK